MTISMLLLAASAFSGGMAREAETEKRVAVTPVAKVMQLLSDQEAKLVKLGEETQKVYEEAVDNCKDTSKELGFAIKTSKSQIEELKALISEKNATLSALSAKMEELTAVITNGELDLKAAAEIR